MAFLVLRGISKSLILIFFWIIFLAFSFWIILTPRVSEAVVCRTSCNDVAIWDVPGTLNCGGNSGCFYSNISHSSSTNGGACSISKISLRLCNPITVYNASCNDVNMSCKEDNCSGLSASNGAGCVVTMGTDGAWACGAPVEKIGTWDASQGKCIECSGLKESTVCADGSSIKLSNVTGNCNASDNSFETACNAIVSSVCDDKAQEAACSPPVGGKCSAAGLCVAANAMSLEINLGTNPVSTGGTSVVTFTVKKDGVAESGATVTITSISCGSLPNPASTTDASGQTTSTFTAPGATNICVVNAKAAKTGFTDGVASVSIPVSMCAGSDYVEYNDYRYVKGESIRLEGVLNAGGLGEWSLCIYNPGGSLREDDMFSLNPAFPRTVNYTSDAIGSWKGLLTAGLGTCPNPFSAAAGCLAATDVVECEDDADCASNNCDSSTYTCVAAAGCNNNGVQDNGETGVDCGGGGCPACAGGDISAPLCQSALIASDVGKLCGVSYTVNAVDVGSWCCSAANGVAFNQMICQAMDPACAVGPGAEICTGGADEDGDLDVDCADSDCAADPACVAPPAAPCSGPGMLTSPLGPGYCSIAEILEKATNYILSLVSVIIILIIIIGGLMYISSAGDEERMRTSKNIILYAIIGFGIILISYALITEVVKVLKG